MIQNQNIEIEKLMIFIQEINKNMNLQKINNVTSKYSDDVVVDDNGDEIQQKINHTQNEIKNTSDEYYLRNQAAEEFWGKTIFEMACPDIDTNPEKYLNNDGQIKLLAELRNKIKSYQQILSELQLQHEQMKKLNHEKNISVSKIVDQLLIEIQNSHQLIELNTKLQYKIDEINNQLQQQEVTIDQLNETVNKYKSGMNLWIYKSLV